MTLLQIVVVLDDRASQFLATFLENSTFSALSRNCPSKQSRGLFLTCITRADLPLFTVIAGSSSPKTVKKVSEDDTDSESDEKGKGMIYQRPVAIK